MCSLWETQHISICGFYFSSSPPTDLLHSSPVIDIHIKCPTHVRFIFIYFITLYYHFYAINLCAWLYFLFLLLFYYSHLLYTLKKKKPLVHPHVLLLFLKIFKNIWPYDSFHMLLTWFDIANLFLTFACLCKGMFVETWWKCFALHFRSAEQKQQIIAFTCSWMFTFWFCLTQ